MTLEPGPRTPAQLYAPGPDGVPVCAVCGAVGQRHCADCAILLLHGQLHELLAQVGLVVATMRETMDAMDRLLRGDA